MKTKSIFRLNEENIKQKKRLVEGFLPQPRYVLSVSWVELYGFAFKLHVMSGSYASRCCIPNKVGYAFGNV